MLSKNIAVPTNSCGRENEHGVCGKPATIWGLVEGEAWENAQISGCAEHYNEIVDHPSVYLTSDAPIEAGEEIL
jgi:hypothetical protein